MASNLLETVRAYLTPDLIDSAGTHVGESSSGINKAVTASIPALLAMFVNRAEKGDAQGLYNDANEAANSNVLMRRVYITMLMKQQTAMYFRIGKNYLVGELVQYFQVNRKVLEDYQDKILPVLLLSSPIMPGSKQIPYRNY
jgi:hypothetical protein